MKKPYTPDSTPVIERLVQVSSDGRDQFKFRYHVVRLGRLPVFEGLYSDSLNQDRLRRGMAVPDVTDDKVRDFLVRVREVDGVLGNLSVCQNRLEGEISQELFTGWDNGKHDIHTAVSALVLAKFPEQSQVIFEAHPVAQLVA